MLKYFSMQTEERNTCDTSHISSKGLGSWGSPELCGFRTNLDAGILTLPTLFPVYLICGDWYRWKIKFPLFPHSHCPLECCKWQSWLFCYIHQPPKTATITPAAQVPLISLSPWWVTQSCGIHCFPGLPSPASALPKFKEIFPDYGRQAPAANLGLQRYLGSLHFNLSSIR